MAKISSVLLAFWNVLPVWNIVWNVLEPLLSFCVAFWGIAELFLRTLENRWRSRRSLSFRSRRERRHFRENS